MATNEIEALKVLVVEDEVHIRGIIRQILNRLGISKVYESEEGGDGFMQTVRLRPHLVLCDFHMKPVDGLTYLSTLRNSKVQDVKDTPVIFLTSNAEQETVIKAKEYSVNGYIVKPVSVNDVKNAISRAISVEFPRDP